MKRAVAFKLFIIFAVLIVLTIGYWLLNRSETERKQQSTEDAYIRADTTTVAAQISGQIEDIFVQDNQFVQRGDTLLKIDDRALQLQLQHSAADLKHAQAEQHRLQALQQQQRSVIAQTQAELRAQNAGLQLSQQDYQRFRNLAADGSGTRQAEQQAEAQWLQQQAHYQKSQASLQADTQQITILQADIEKAQADLEAIQAQIAHLKLQRSYSEIHAPIQGFIQQKIARVGGYAQVGNPLLSITPLDALYIEAHFRETQLGKMCAGQTVDIKVDALPQIQFKGRITSLGAASAVSLSAITPHNATGNFTKIVQRLPVRIQFTANQAALSQLRMGMSVKTTVLIDSQKCKH